VTSPGREKNGERRRKGGREGRPRGKPLSSWKSCSLEREFLENREKLVIKARERRLKKRRRRERWGRTGWKRRKRRAAGERKERGHERGRVAQENAWKCIPRSEGVPA